MKGTGELFPLSFHRCHLSGNILIQTKNLYKRFNGLTAVYDVNFELKEGEVAGIIGPNGAGKSTFFNLLTGFFPPSEGKILFMGQDITMVPSYHRVRMGLVRTFQLVSVFESLTALNNLVLAKIRFDKNYDSKSKFFFKDAHHAETVNACLEALKTVGISDRADVKTFELSYGDKRKLEIALALSLNPRILLLDEPLSGLSDVEINEVLDLIRLVKKNFTLILIEHKISRILDLVERLSVMHEGKLIAEGKPQEVLCDPLVRQVYWGREEVVCSLP
ncbi:MAG: ABC transporter ATP-binding protein [Deltaproteobacteria bacterium]|nr:ABC transporter ATP-binding protein [Deltaproteobacteria bacterium]